MDVVAASKFFSEVQSNKGLAAACTLPLCRSAAGPPRSGLCAKERYSTNSSASAPTTATDSAQTQWWGANKDRRSGLRPRPGCRRLPTFQRPIQIHHSCPTAAGAAAATATAFLTSLSRHFFSFHMIKQRNTHTFSRTTIWPSLPWKLLRVSNTVFLFQYSSYCIPF
jgi:hypothetical protein